MLPLFRSDSLARFRLLGERVYLRPPVRADYKQWVEIRDLSRAFLEPWEPAWGDDALEKAVYRDRVTVPGGAAAFTRAADAVGELESHLDHNPNERLALLDLLLSLPPLP